MKEELETQSTYITYTTVGRFGWHVDHPGVATTSSGPPLAWQ